MRNEEVAELLHEIGDYLEIQGKEFKPRAYHTAASNIEALSEPIEEIHERGELQEIDGVGESIAEKVAEYLETGELEYYQKLAAEHPEDIESLTRVEGIGPKQAQKLYDALGIQTLEELERAADEGRIAEVEGFGEKSQANILEHIDVAMEGEERTLIGDAFDRAEGIRDRIAAVDVFEDVCIVGSFRRRRPTIGDVDVLATASDATEAMGAFCGFEDVDEVIARGETKSSVKISGGLRVDLRIVDESSWGSALLYFTGSKDHNIEVRDRAQDRDWKLNEYGLYDVSDVSEEEEGRRAGERIASETEAEVYDALDMDWIAPELRENTGEVDAAVAGELPDLVNQEDVRGDFQSHTTDSDGEHTVREMAERADDLGREYLVVTDHGPALDVVTGVSDREEFDEQAAEITEINDDPDVDVRLLHGLEAEVQENGLDIPDAWAEEVDVLVAGMHLQPEDPTDRLVEAMESNPVDVLAHPLNRQIHEREPLDLDLERVMGVAAEEAVFVEINGQPARLDLDWRNVKQYREDVTFVVSSDAHRKSELELVDLAVSQARRGWLEAGDLANTRSLDELPFG
ncbi:MAG: helix-hairpin-helix domain-containing protein [Halopenitus sp.]